MILARKRLRSILPPHRHPRHRHTGRARQETRQRNKYNGAISAATNRLPEASKHEGIAGKLQPCDPHNIGAATIPLNQPR